MKAVIVLGFLSGAGCGMYAGELHHSTAYQEREVLRSSLMKSENPLLTEEAIQRLLSSRIKIPDKAKLAVHAFPHRGGELHEYGAGVSFLPAKREFLSAMEEPLAKTGRFSEISHLPRMMLPLDPSLTRLRETAALMQADLLLVYWSRSERVTLRYFFIPNEVKVVGTLEFFLMDVKTGVVPIADAFETVHVEKQVKDDDRIEETQRRAEKEATLEVLRQAAVSLGRFFKQG